MEIDVDICICIAEFHTEVWYVLVMEAMLVVAGVFAVVVVVCICLCVWKSACWWQITNSK